MIAQAWVRVRCYSYGMRVSDYDYDLPPRLIAQTPVEPRDSARLLVVERATGTLSHHVFSALHELLRPGDVLVANDSRVLPARLYGRRPGTSGAVEALLLREDAPDEWIALVRPGRRIRPGETLLLDGRLPGTESLLTATVLDRLAGGERRLRLRAATGTVREAIHRVGVTPLPPYIHADLHDPERYQTVYARDEGSVAAPTAGLHFTPDTLRRLHARGIVMRHVTLHVGAGTFKPMASDDVGEHVMHAEWAELDAETAEGLNRARAEGRRVIAVGTTSVRVLESAATPEGVRAYAGWTDIFITPGRPFHAVDGLITNFHLPRSTLLLLVSAFAGKGLIASAYAEAIAREYRFYSFGDAMLIL